jgi:hypothetical protein
VRDLFFFYSLFCLRQYFEINIYNTIKQSFLFGTSPYPFCWRNLYVCILSYFFDLIHRNICSYVWLRCDLFEYLFIILTSHQLIYKLVTPLNHFVNFLYLFLFCLFIENFFILIFFWSLYCVVQWTIRSTLLHGRFS